jgi:hypothetical protein
LCAQPEGGHMGPPLQKTIYRYDRRFVSDEGGGVEDRGGDRCYAAREMEDSEGRAGKPSPGGEMVSRLDAVDHVNSGTSPWYKR